LLGIPACAGMTATLSSLKGLSGTEPCLLGINKEFFVHLYVKNLKMYEISY
jgi:hypothetical protein